MQTPIEDYVRNAVVLNVVDGDTLDLNVDLGFRLWSRQRVRVLGINCPEMHGASAVAGAAAKAATEDWVHHRAGPVTVRTHLDKMDSFGRLLAEIWGMGESLGDYLLVSGHAVSFKG